MHINNLFKPDYDSATNLSYVYNIYICIYIYTQHIQNTSFITDQMTASSLAFWMLLHSLPGILKVIFGN